MRLVTHKGFAAEALGLPSAPPVEIRFFLRDVASVGRLTSASGAPLCDVALVSGRRFRLVGKEAARFLREWGAYEEAVGRN